MKAMSIIAILMSIIGMIFGILIIIAGSALSGMSVLLRPAQRPVE
jgi:hypothetical protein